LKPTTLINGLPADSVSVQDRGLAYGDGVFRTLRVAHGKPLHWQAHHAKLVDDCAALGLDTPSFALLDAELAQLARQHPDCVVKIIVTRGVGERGYASPPSAIPTRILIAAPLPVYPADFFDVGVTVQVCVLRLAHQPRLAGVKHLNRLENVLARQEWSDPAIAEGLLLDAKGNVISGVMSNLLMLKGDTLHTPDLSRCGVAGVTRQRIMSLASGLGLSLASGNYSLDFLRDADEVWLCNSVIGVWRVAELAAELAAQHPRRWPESALFPRLRKLLHDLDP